MTHGAYNVQIRLTHFLLRIIWNKEMLYRHYSSTSL